MAISVFVVAVVLIGALIWSCTAVKAEEVENQGIVIDADGHIVSSEVSGTVSSIVVREGGDVEAGGTLFILDSSAVEAERCTYEASKEHYASRISMIDQLISSLESGGRNPFTDAGDEKEFSDIWKSYRNEVSQIAVQDQTDSVRLKYLSDLYSERSTLQREIRTAEIYESTMDADNIRIGFIDRMIDELESGGTENPFTDAGDEKEFRNLFDSYVSQYEALPDDAQKDSYRRGYVSDLYTQRSQLVKEVSSARVYVEAASGYTERLSNVGKMIDALEKSSTVNPFDDSASQREFRNLFEAYLEEIGRSDVSDQRESVKLKYISSLQSERNTCDQQVRSAESSISVCDVRISKYTIRSPASGVLHLDAELSVGSFVQAGTSIGSIDTGSGKRIEMYVSAHDRARLEVGQDCRFTVDGLLQTEFGSMEGRVESISSDATVSDSGAFFRVTVSFEGRSLTDDRGNEVSIVNGMTVRMWTVYEKSTYMDYFLEKLGFGK